MTLFYPTINQTPGPVAQLDRAALLQGAGYFPIINYNGLKQLVIII